MSGNNIQVAIKVRPILRQEKEQKQASNWKVAGNSIQLIDGHLEPFYFDHIFDQDVSNQVIFDTMAKQIVDSGLKGFNGTIFAYGQTSSGKTYTMMGDNEQNPGVMVLATKEIFKEIEKATDRQFLLRVGYIEIYNEKVYDLLNKASPELKIHESPNGDVSVNCSEYIITCEEDLLSYLRLGSKQRKIGETNMNERSSRSHAIFRIIIESRKTDKTDDDSVQISILNLVDLAGSERADQTGATGSRLKEGSHINKSLLFLSCVIKQLAEDKYVNYRDSKLTRILQASLGGNALTAIICTINPTAVDETLSTLSFANRAKVVKNKPQVNEVLTDAAMMKRLEKEINRLQNELEEEKSKNSQIKVCELQKRLNEEILKIINSNSSYSVKAAKEKRRRTWCPSSATPPIQEFSSAKTETCLPQPTMASKMPTKLMLPKPGMNFTPHITLRDVYYQQQLEEIECSPNIDEEFIPAEEVCFDEANTPRTSPSRLKADFQTPVDALKLRTTSLTPQLTEKDCYQIVLREFKELETFTNLENKLNVEHDTYKTLKFKLENAEKVIADYEKDREDFAFLKVEHIETVTCLAQCHKRCMELESKVIKFESKVSEFEKSSKATKERHEKEVTELRTKIAKLEMENREAVSLEFEFQQHKNKSKRRENELLGALEEKQKEINKLERTLQKITIDVLNNSKEELNQLSKSVKETESVCVNCKDLQRILAENKELTQNLEKVNLDCQSLQLNLEKVSSEAESAKLRADALETENDGLKKDAERLNSLHGTLEDVQNQIVSLQGEKCKLDSVKIEFEVMSKETANKIAEKINISQEVEALTAQKDTLATECDKLLADIAANGSVREDLNKLRTENESLRSELQTIKAKLEAAQSDYDNLMTENQSKSDNYDKLNMEVLSARNQLQTLQSEYRDFQQKYEQIQAECNKHEDTIGEIQSEYDSIQNKYQCLQKEYEKLENDSVQSIADCDRVQSQNENLETEIRELKIKVEEAQRKLLENDSLQLELESLKSEMNRLQGGYDKSLSIKTKSEENVVDLRQENAKLKQDLENLQLQFNEMQKEYDDISTQLVDNFADYETLEAELKRYKESAMVYNLAEDFKAMKVKAEQLEAENSSLVKENMEWKKTVSSMTKSMRDKCDEREQLVTLLEQVKNESARSESDRKSFENCVPFSQLAETFAEIEIQTGHGSKTFQAAGAGKSAGGGRMIIGSISGITQGTFNELRGAIEFAVSTDEHKSSNEIYDSLEMEDNSTSANSCDSLEGTSRQSNEAQINELLEEKSHLFERIRDLEEELAVLKIESEKLTSVRAELDDNKLIVDQLNGEKLNLITICDESRCRIGELNEIISRAECDNKKLIADCEQLKRTVESECAVESVPRELYEEIKRQHWEMCEKIRAIEKKEAERIEDYAELRGQLLALQSKPGGEAIVEKLKQQVAEFEKLNSEISETGYRCENEISKLEAMVNGMTAQLKKLYDMHNDAGYKCEESEIIKLEAMVNTISAQLERLYEKDNDPDMPVRAELEDTITELHEQLQTCKCIELQAALDEKTQRLAELGDDKAAKYEQHICTLIEQLKQQECKFQEVQIEIIELKTSLEGKVQESAEGRAKFEDLNGRYSKLQADYDELQRVLLSERVNAAELGKTVLNLEKIEEECNLLQDSVACLSETVATLGEERHEAIKQKEVLEQDYNKLSEKLLFLEQKYDSLKSSKDELGKLVDKLKTLEEKNVAIVGENKAVLEEMLKLEQEKKKITEECQVLKSSERSLHGQLQKLVQDHELMVRDKERLERECHTSSNELKKIKQEWESNSREMEDLQRKCEELEGALGRVSAEKKIFEEELEEAKEQHEKLKECHKAERNILEEQCSALTSEVQSLDTTKCELQSALDRAKNHSEFLLQQSKDLEEQYNMELCTVRNSNNSMAQQIDDLHEKLEKAEGDLQTALDRLNSEKNELIIQLTNTNNSLVTRSSELEEKFALLEQQLEESKRSLSAEVRLKKVLEKGNSEKEELIAQLSNKNDSLMTKSSELEKKFAAEVHLKQVLEKANTERDDLIVQLTNNNNSLATKSSELEERLAILGNQFEESKRHLSAEVNRLNQLLTEANNMTTSQSSKIEDLRNKIQTLEDNVKRNQNAVSERDSLLQKLDRFQEQYDALAVQHANLELTRSSFEAELNSARAVVVENTTLVQRVSEIQSTLKEMQLKCNSLSSANEGLQLKNKELVKQLEDTIQQANECKRLNNELVKLRGDHEKMQEELSKSKKNFAEWKLKECSLEEQVGKLIAEKKAIQEKLETAEKNNLNKITQLEQQIQLQSANLSKSISPKKGMDHLMGENHQLKVKNMSLMDKLDSCQKSQNEERKNRRLSTHDERRFQSFWDNNRDVSTMTDPTNVECNCTELDRKLNELKMQLLIRDSQVNTLSMELKNHPLKTENATLKKLVIEEESKQQQLRQEIKRLKQLIVDRTNESRHCVKCAEALKKIFVHSATQTADTDESECYRKLLGKYEDLKTICRARYTKIKELEDALSKGKENANDNFSSLHNQQYKQKYEQLQKEFKIIQGKYQEAKILCNFRYDQIKNLSSQLSGNS